MNLTKAILAGFGVGILTGFLGVGGGFLIVPALVFFGGLPMKEAVGTSLLVIALNCVAGLFGHLSYGLFDLKIDISRHGSGDFRCDFRDDSCRTKSRSADCRKVLHIGFGSGGFFNIEKFTE